MNRIAITLAAALAATSSAVAQTELPATAPGTAIVLAPVTATNAVLRAGTPVSFKMLEEVTTKDKAARVGQRINLEVSAPIEIDDNDRSTV